MRTSWTVQTTPNRRRHLQRPGGSVVQLGDRLHRRRGYDNNGADKTLAEVWGGTSWTVQTTPNPEGATDISLYGVSCSSATACTAVGTYRNSSDTQVMLTEVWDGTSWTVQTTPNPSGAISSELEAVSCRSATACTAVGTYDNNGADETLAEVWNGTSWTVQTTPNPSGPIASELEAVSCSSVTACTAVGYSDDSGTFVTLAEAWNGASWAVQTTPKPPGAIDSDLDGVSCSSATACTAVWSYDNSGHGAPLAEVWNGTSWTVQTIPNPPAAIYSYLDTVSCSSATACTAVGAYDDNNTLVTLAEVWNGTSWTVQTTPNPKGANESYLQGVSCSSATACTAVGMYENRSGVTVTLAEVWNGTSWTVQTTPKLRGDTFSYLAGVSCTSATACTAVGTYDDSGTDKTLAEVWNGTSWIVQTTPNPKGPTESGLTAVSCSSATACTAVGIQENSSNIQVMFSEVWNGTSWSLQTTPNPKGATDTDLYGVSCSSATACTAVGTYDNGGALVEVWNGTSWTLQTIPNPSGASDLDAVSCSSATACTAVGMYDNNGVFETLAEVRNGTSWTVQTTPTRLAPPRATCRDCRADRQPPAPPSGLT